MKKICVVTGTRADYGLLYWLMKEIMNDRELQLQIVVTGMHLSPEFGLTYKQIEHDGFIINEKIEMLISGDTPSAVAKSIGIGTIGFSDSFSRLQPDLIVILGDRFEALAAAQTALILNIPIAHIHGGEVTYGAYDDSIRHAITKMSCLHFVSTEEYRKRVIRLGEHPNRVFNVGATGIENILKLNLLTKEQLEKDLDMDLTNQLFLITQHPVTLSEDPMEGIKELLEALEHYPDSTMILTKANADNDGRKINQLINEFVAKKPLTRRLFDSLGQLRYLSLMKHADVVIGNSSSGLFEAPYLRTPTVNIGDRQKGRVRPDSVIDTVVDVNEIVKAIKKALDYSFQEDSNIELFGKGNTSKKIVKLIKENMVHTNKKEFYNGEFI